MKESSPTTSVPLKEALEYHASQENQSEATPY